MGTPELRKLFISYRRDDAEEAAGRLSDHLVTQFGRENIFMDVDGIDPGRDFRKVIDETLTQCDVLLGVIGKNWIDAKDASGNRRLEDPSDFVRLEIASALRRDIPVIPVRVQGATIPKADQLPDDLKDFSYRNAVELTHERWNSDVQVLVEKLHRVLAAPANCEPDPVTAAATAPPLHQAPRPTPVAPVSAPVGSEPVKKKNVKKIVKWSLVGFFSLSFFGSIGNGDASTAVFSVILIALFAWDPFKWFVYKN